jgi:DNA-binding PadR family transcriptional regulator
MHEIKRDGYWVSREVHDGGKARKLHVTADLGREELALARERIREFIGEAIS